MKMLVKGFDEGAPNEWIGNLNSFTEIWGQNYRPFRSSCATIPTIPCNESLTQFEVALSDGKVTEGKEDDSKSSSKEVLVLLMVEEVICAVTASIFPYEALETQI
jgi:hypothetical protein